MNGWRLRLIKNKLKTGHRLRLSGYDLVVALEHPKINTHCSYCPLLGQYCFNCINVLMDNQVFKLIKDERQNRGES